MFNRDILLRYRPPKGLNLNYKIMYNMTGEKYGKSILDSKLDLLASYNVLDVMENGNVSVSLRLDSASLTNNNAAKNVAYTGDTVFLTYSPQLEVIERKGNIPTGLLDYFNFSFPGNSVKNGAFWDSNCCTSFPNMKNLIEVEGTFRFTCFEGFKGYNCSRLSFSLHPKIIVLSPDIHQTLSGNGYILFDSNYSIIAFMCLNTIADTGSLGLVFRSSLKKEVSPFTGKNVSPSSPISSSDEYFFTRY